MIRCGIKIMQNTTYTIIKKPMANRLVRPFRQCGRIFLLRNENLILNLLDFSDAMAII